MRHDENRPPPAGRCAVCQDDFAAGDEARRLNCFHQFHRRCADAWLVRSLTCPLCKADLPHTTHTQRRQDEAAGKSPAAPPQL
eukprot:gene19875-56930_t